MTRKILKTNEEWKKVLSPAQYAVTCLGETEPRFSGDYLDLEKEGIYRCVRCGNKLFSSSAKFDSGSGWPSFFDVFENERVEISSLPINGSEILCARCGSHLGHVFEDGPWPTGRRYCVNSTAIKFDCERDNDQLNATLP